MSEANFMTVEEGNVVVIEITCSIGENLSFNCDTSRILVTAQVGMSLDGKVATDEYAVNKCNSMNTMGGWYFSKMSQNDFGGYDKCMTCSLNFLCIAEKSCNVFFDGDPSSIISTLNYITKKGVLIQPATKCCFVGDVIDEFPSLKERYVEDEFVFGHSEDSNDLASTRTQFSRILTDERFGSAILTSAGEKTVKSGYSIAIVKRGEQYFVYDSHGLSFGNVSGGAYGHCGTLDQTIDFLVFRFVDILEVKQRIFEFTLFSPSNVLSNLKRPVKKKLRKCIIPKNSLSNHKSSGPRGHRPKFCSKYDINTVWVKNKKLNISSSRIRPKKKKYIIKSMNLEEDHYINPVYESKSHKKTRKKKFSKKKKGWRVVLSSNKPKTISLGDRSVYRNCFDFGCCIEEVFGCAVESTEVCLNVKKRKNKKKCVGRTKKTKNKKHKKNRKNKKNGKNRKSKKMNEEQEELDYKLLQSLLEISNKDSEQKTDDGRNYEHKTDNNGDVNHKNEQFERSKMSNYGRGTYCIPRDYDVMCYLISKNRLDPKSKEIWEKMHLMKEFNESRRVFIVEDLCLGVILKFWYFSKGLNIRSIILPSKRTFSSVIKSLKSNGGSRISYEKKSSFMKIKSCCFSKFDSKEFPNEKRSNEESEKLRLVDYEKKTFDIFVKMPNEQTVPLNVSSSDSFRDISKIMKQKRCEWSDDMSLWINGKCMQSNSLFIISDLCIRPGSTLFAKKKGFGGMKPRSGRKSKKKGK